jgi:hypothetical protein
VEDRLIGLAALGVLGEIKRCAFLARARPAVDDHPGAAPEIRHGPGNNVNVLMVCRLKKPEDHQTSSVQHGIIREALPAWPRPARPWRHRRHVAVDLE